MNSDSIWIGLLILKLLVGLPVVGIYLLIKRDIRRDEQNRRDSD